MEQWTLHTHTHTHAHAHTHARPHTRTRAHARAHAHAHARTRTHTATDFCMLFQYVKNHIYIIWNVLKQPLTHISNLTYWGWVTHICVSKITIIGSNNGLYQCFNVVNWTLGNKPQWNLNRNSYIFIAENEFEHVAWKWRPFCLGLDVLI